MSPEKGAHASNPVLEAKAPSVLIYGHETRSKWADLADLSDESDSGLMGGISATAGLETAGLAAVPAFPDHAAAVPAVADHAEGNQLTGLMGGISETGSGHCSLTDKQLRCLIQQAARSARSPTSAFLALQRLENKVAESWVPVGNTSTLDDEASSSLRPSRHR